MKLTVRAGLREREHRRETNAQFDVQFSRVNQALAELDGLNPKRLTSSVGARIRDISARSGAKLKALPGKLRNAKDEPPQS